MGALGPNPGCQPWALTLGRNLAGAPDGELGPDDWPTGCCGYAVNLVRPARAGLRGAVLYPLLGSALVFETLEDLSPRALSLARHTPCLNSCAVRGQAGNTLVAASRTAAPCQRASWTQPTVHR